MDIVQLQEVMQTVGLSGLFAQEVISSRRGACLAKVSNGSRIMALKIATDDGDREAIIREARTMRGLPASIIGGLYVNHAEGAIPWLLSDWITGESASEAAGYLRASQDFAGLIGLLLGIVDTTATVHRLGFIHGDLQPAHFIKTSDSWTLIDWGLARHRDQAAPFYKGALVHYVSPEVAEQMLAGRDVIEHDQLSEVYSLSAVLFFLFTGKTRAFYGSYDDQATPMDRKLSAIIIGRVHTFEQLGILGCGPLEAVLAKGLATNRRQRFQSVAELQQALASI